MAAAELTETLVGGVGSELKTTGTALKTAVYSVDVVTQNDWVILGDFSVVSFATATIDASGAINPCTIDGTTTNKVVLTSATTGAATLFVVGY